MKKSHLKVSFCLLHVHVQKEKRDENLNSPTEQNDKRKRKSGFTQRKKGNRMNDNEAFLYVYMRQRVMQT